MRGLLVLCVLLLNCIGGNLQSHFSPVYHNPIGSDAPLQTVSATALEMKRYSKTDKRLFHLIAAQESGHDCGAVNRHTGAIGIGQVMPQNVKSWTQQCLGITLSPQKFADACSLQELVVRCKLKEYRRAAVAKGESRYEACRSAAATWYSGSARRKNDARPVATGPSIATYTKEVCEGMRG